MLHAVQAHFLPLLKSALPPVASVSAGPAVDPVPGDSFPRVVITASRLALLFNQDDDDPLASRTTAHFAAVQRWSGDGTARDFTVPDDIKGDITELECPPGRPLRVGDDYAVDGRTVRLMRPPPPGQHNLQARLRGGPARGYLDRRPCVVTVEVHVWTNGPAQLASTSARVLAALLAAAVDVPHLEATPHDDLGVRVRLLRPVASWLSTNRDDVAGLLRDSFEFQLRGELEQHVVVGQPEPAGIIENIVYRGDR